MYVEKDPAYISNCQLFMRMGASAAAFAAPLWLSFDKRSDRYDHWVGGRRGGWRPSSGCLVLTLWVVFYTFPPPVLPLGALCPRSYVGKTGPAYIHFCQLFMYVEKARQTLPIIYVSEVLSARTTPGSRRGLIEGFCSPDPREYAWKPPRSHRGSMHISPPELPLGASAAASAASAS